MTNYHKIQRKNNIILAMGGGCQCCGYNKYYGALEFHHLDPSEKDVIIAAMLNRHKTINSIIAEVKKCILLCCLCHREFHAGLRQIPETCQRFDETKFRNLLAEAHANLYASRTLPRPPCPECGGPKEDYRAITCSVACHKKTLWRTDWSSVNLSALLYEQGLSYVKVSELLGVSDVAVKKHAKKLPDYKPRMPRKFKSPDDRVLLFRVQPILSSPHY